MTTRILLIDKKTETFDDFREKLSSVGDQWELDTCTNLRNVLKSIRENPPEIVICAHRPSVIDGAKKLKSVAKNFPHIERFILAREKNRDAFASEIGNTFHFLPCPCPATTLQLELQRVITLNDWLGRDKIKDIVSSVSDFPSLPPVYMKVVNAVNSPDASVENIAEIIMGDIAVTAKILQTVNSSFYGLEEKVSDISEAISILGMESVKNIVLAIQAFGRIKDPAQQALVDKLWRHSMSVAIAAKRIAKHETQCDKKAEEAYTAGLFHDIGKLVLIKSSPKKYNEAQELARESEIGQWEAENEIIGCNHAEVGAYLLGRWGLPVNVIEAAALHHKPSESYNSEFTILSAVHAANAIVWDRNKDENPLPDSAPDDEYLAEIGCVGSWEDWKDVAVGKEPESMKATPLEDQSNRDSGAQSSNTIDAADSFGSPAKRKESSGRNKALMIAAIAATIVVGILLFTPSSDSGTEIELVADAQDDWSAGSFAMEVENPSTDGSAESDETEIVETETDPAEDSVELEANEELVEVATEPSQEETVDLEAEDVPIPAVEAEVLEVVSKRPQIRLTGIFYNANNPLASINGKLLRPGDIVDGARVLSIEERFVTVSYEGETLQINLPK